MTKTTFINQLPTEKQFEIAYAISEELVKNGLHGEELENAIDTALDGRLCDLEDIINIEKYL